MRMMNTGVEKKVCGEFNDGKEEGSEYRDGKEEGDEYRSGGW